MFLNKKLGFDKKGVPKIGTVWQTPNWLNAEYEVVPMEERSDKKYLIDHNLVPLKALKGHFGEIKDADPLCSYAKEFKNSSVKLIGFSTGYSEEEIKTVAPKSSTAKKPASKKTKSKIKKPKKTAKKTKSKKSTIKNVQDARIVEDARIEEMLQRARMLNPGIA